jgi:hypothetical protein
MTSTVLPALPEYVIKEYEQAARHFCSTMFVNADQPDPEEPPYTPLWKRYAKEMALLQLKLQCMRMYGHGITV